MRTHRLITMFGMQLVISFCCDAVVYNAVTIVPVADLLGDAAQHIAPKKYVFDAYNQLPLTSQHSSHCSRIHQILFNEIVTVLEEKNDEVRIAIPNLFFQSAQDTKKNSTFWALKKNFISLDTLKKSGIKQQMFPDPIQYDSTKNNVVSPATVVLIAPYYDPEENRTFSVGTRFVMKKNNPTTVEVNVLNTPATKIITMHIPKKNILIENSNLLPEERIKIFLTLIKSWSQPKQGFIPYVWGGCSYTQPCLQEQFTKIPTLNCYARNDYCQNTIKTGFDCTGLIARAAQAAGMPYFFKNSTTILNNLRELTSQDTLHNGDIIWFQGHVMIISDVKKNLVIEARSYDHGWGKIHEAPIHAIFKNVSSLKNLLELCTQHGILERINRDGKVAQEITLCKILSLRSIWQKH